MCSIGMIHADHGSWPWQSVLDMPGFEIGVPVEGPSPEPRLDVDARLVDVDVAAEDLVRDVEHAAIAGEAVEHWAEAMERKQCAYLVAVGFDETFQSVFVVRPHLGEFFPQGLDPLFEIAWHHDESVAPEVGQRCLAEAVRTRRFAPDHDRVGPVEDTVRATPARGL